MVKKRIIFTLLYDNGWFMLSRNFRLQKVGDLAWLQTHYNFSRISFSIDELIVLDVSRTERSPAAFCDALKALTQGCFVPIAAGGGIRSIEAAHRLLRSGADKIVLNTALFENETLIADLSSEFGQQCIVAALDIKRAPNGDFQTWVESGTVCLEGSASSRAFKVACGPIGEIYLNSMDRDGTGRGLPIARPNRIRHQQTSNFGWWGWQCYASGRGVGGPARRRCCNGTFVKLCGRWFNESPSGADFGRSRFTAVGYPST